MASGLNQPFGVAVDEAGNVYIADTENQAVKKWSAATQQVTTLVGSGLSLPTGVAVDGAGNVYIADFGNSAIEEWSIATQQVTTLVGSGQSNSTSVAVDGAGNVYFGDGVNSAIKEWSAATQQVTTLLGSGVSNPEGVAVDTAGDVYFSNASRNTVKRFTPGFIGLAQTTQLVGPAAGSSQVELTTLPGDQALPWTATTTDTWIHLTAGSATTTTPAQFTYDSNSGSTRMGTISFNGGAATLTVTQAGSPYIAGSVVFPLANLGSSYPNGVAVDGAGNVYFADSGISAIKEWHAATDTVTTLVSSGLNQPYGVAVDEAGNVYIADSGNNAIKKWNAATQTMTTLVSSGLNNPCGVAVDEAGNVYIADTNNNAIKEWSAATQTVTTLVSSGLNQPTGVAVDGTGNVYIADTYNSAIKEWNAATQTVTALDSGSIRIPTGVAVDGTGNVYIADTFNQTIQKYSPAFIGPASFSEPATAGEDQLLPVLPSTTPLVVNSDQAWLDVLSYNVLLFSANTGTSARVAHITVLGQSITVTQAGVQLATASLDQSALTFTNVTGGTTSAAQTVNLSNIGNATLTLSSVAVSGSGFAISNNTCGATLLPAAQCSVAVTYTPYAVAQVTGALTFTDNSSTGTTQSVSLSGTGVAVLSLLPASESQLVSPGTGSSDLLIGTVPQGSTVAWTAVPNVAWLHTSSTGTGTGTLNFTYDANAGSTRSGTISIGPLTLTVTQAGSPYVAGGAVSTLVSSGLNYPVGVAVDGASNLYIADYGNSAVKEWSAATQQVTTLVGSGLNNPNGVTVDGAGNVYFEDSGTSAIKEWSAATQQVTTLVGSGLNLPAGVAVDGAGNVYFADNGNSAIQEWSAATQQVTTLVGSGLNNPYGVAVDGAGNVYIADDANGAIKEWRVATQKVTTLVGSGLSAPEGVAVDGAGNVYIADTHNNAIKKYISGFIGPAAFMESAAAGTDSLLPVLPSGTPLSGASSDQSWLTIGALANDVLSFSFLANTSTVARVAHISVLGQSLTVTQAADSAGSVTANAGTTPQSATISTAFARALAVTVKDASNSPVAGVSVVFTAPASGASGTFGNSTTTTTVPTDAFGIAVAPFTANTTAGGPYSVTAVAGALSTSFSLMNTPGAPGSITPNTGTTRQSATVSTAFANPLAVTVKDSFNNPISGVNVVFTAPATGASGIFNTTNTITVATNASGIASAPFTANVNRGGPYNVTAATNSLATAFALTNVFLTQTITFGAIPTQTIGTPLMLTASASSTLPVSYQSKPTYFCTISGALVSFLTPGQCSITASQPGSASYSAATQVTQVFTVGSNAPTISNIQTLSIGDTAETILWTTDQPSTSLVQYGSTSSYSSSSTPNNSLVTSHSVTVTGLSANTTYNFDIVSSNATSVTTQTPNATFKTTPSVGYLGFWGVNNSGVTISWSTDTPANTVVAYGTTPALGQFSSLQAALTAGHGVVLTGLNSGTTYYFQAQSTDASGNTGGSAITSFTTTGAPTSPAPVITNVATSGIGMSSATITWSTDQNSTSQVNYGTSAAYSSSSPLTSIQVTSHSVTLTNLSPGTSYNFDVVSANATGTAIGTSSNYTFTTLTTPSAPVITGVSSGTPGSSSVTLTWTTDQPSSSQVNFGTSTAYGSNSPLNSTLVSSHSVTLTSLTPNTTYDFEVVSINAGGLSSIAGNYSFTTAALSTAPAPYVGYVGFWGTDDARRFLGRVHAVLWTFQRAEPQSISDSVAHAGTGEGFD